MQILITPMAELLTFQADSNWRWGGGEEEAEQNDRLDDDESGEMCPTYAGVKLQSMSSWNNMNCELARADNMHSLSLIKRHVDYMHFAARSKRQSLTSSVLALLINCNCVIFMMALLDWTTTWLVDGRRLPDVFSLTRHLASRHNLTMYQRWWAELTMFDCIL